MWRVLLLTTVLIGGAAGATAQPADCPDVSTGTLSMPLGIDLAGRPGVPAGTHAKARVAVPLQAPVTDCGEPSSPADVLHGQPGDLLRGTPLPASGSQ